MQVVKCNDYPARSPAQVVKLGSRTSIAVGSHTKVVMQGYELVVLFGVTVKGQGKVEVEVWLLGNLVAVVLLYTGIGLK